MAERIELENAGNDEAFPVVLSRQGSRRDHSYKGYINQLRVSKRVVRRLVKKSGKSNIFRSKLPTLWDRYIRDLANTLVDSRWRWLVISLSSSFVLSWVIFAACYMLIAAANGDDDPKNLAPCLTGIHSFGGYVMFSMETQQTIGYGSRYINRHCPEGTFLMCLQIIMGCAICGAMVSIVNAKMVRPHQMISTNLFSKMAVIGIRDGKLCLIFRVRDEGARYSIGTAINAYLVQSRPGEPFLKSLTLQPHGLLIWPLEIVHEITPDSPFYDLSAKELITKRFEIIAQMHGTSAVTGQCSKTRTSYLSTEILWGRKFKQCIHYDQQKCMYKVNRTEFNVTEEVLTPLCSAQRLDEVIHEITTPTANNDDALFTYDTTVSEHSDNESVYDNLHDNASFNLVNEIKSEIRDEENYDLERLVESLERQMRMYT